MPVEAVEPVETLYEEVLVAAAAAVASDGCSSAEDSSMCSVGSLDEAHYCSIQVFGSKVRSPKLLTPLVLSPKA